MKEINFDDDIENLHLKEIQIKYAFPNLYIYESKKNSTKKDKMIVNLTTNLNEKKKKINNMPSFHKKISDSYSINEKYIAESDRDKEKNKINIAYFQKFANPLLTIAPMQKLLPSFYSNSNEQDVYNLNRKNNKNVKKIVHNFDVGNLTYDENLYENVFGLDCNMNKKEKNKIELISDNFLKKWNRKFIINEPNTRSSKIKTLFPKITNNFNSEIENNNNVSNDNKNQMIKKMKILEKKKKNNVKYYKKKQFSQTKIDEDINPFADIIELNDEDLEMYLLNSK